MQEITPVELKEKIDAEEDLQLIDVRQPDEHAFARIDGSVLIPMAEIVPRMNELDPGVPAIVYCRSGVRSARVIEALKQYGYAGELSNLRGGILAWSAEVDPSIPRY